MTIVAVCVYNRFSNLQLWLNAWKQCNQANAELIIIHNYDNLLERNKYFAECRDAGIKYVGRVNKGFDMGALQDVCRERLAGFPNDWDNLLWCADDMIPMRRDFVKVFWKALEGQGVACTEISAEINLHIRTSGFIISKQTSLKLQFPADPITTKMDCYQFEHKGENTFMNQIRRMSKGAIMVGELETSPLWDTGHRFSLNRWDEHNAIFNKPTKVCFIAPIYNTFPEIVTSLICQTYPHWELLLIHDGPNSTGLKKYIDFLNDKRITYIETKERKNVWGHPIRKWALEEVKAGRLAIDSEYIVIGNADNYLMPPFIEYYLEGFKNNPTAIAAYCDSFVHGYLSPQLQANGQYINHKFGVLKTRLELGWIDCNQAMIKKEVAAETGWDDMQHSSDWTYFSKIISRYGKDKWSKIHGCLMSHN